MARTRTDIGDFPGLISNADPMDIPNGAAQVQVNLTSRVFGELRTRRGFRDAQFESETTVTDLAAD